jgi:hypothetical protein
MGDVVAGGDVEGHDLERGALCLPLEEGRPRLAVGVDAADALMGWRQGLALIAGSPG